MGCGSSKAAGAAEPGSVEQSDDTLLENLEHVTVEGMAVQHFDAARDEETEETKADSQKFVTKVGTKVLEIAPKMAVGMTLGAITGAPGMIFGIGGVVATKAADSLVERLKTLTGAVLTVEAVRVAGLKEGFQGAMGKRKMNPYVKAQLVIDGVKYKGKHGMNVSSTGKTAAFSSGGQDVNFPAGKHKCTVGFPLDDMEKAKGACLLLAVDDKPDVLKGVPGKDYHCGSAVVWLGQLVAALEEHDTVEAPVNLALTPQGVLRVKVSIAQK